MSNKKFDLGKAPHINITYCAGNLVVRSAATLDVIVKGEHVVVNQGEGGLSLSANNDLHLLVPDGSQLSVENAHSDVVIKNIRGSVHLHEVHGDTVLLGLDQVKLGIIHSNLSAKNIDGAVNAETINGDAVLRQVGGIHLGVVHGDLVGRYVQGAASVGEANGDVSLSTVNGDVSLGKGYRDVNLKNLGGIVSIGHVSGDIRLIGSLISGEHSFAANGDILLRWPVESPLNLTANAPSIKNRLPLENLVEKENLLIGTLGDGKTDVTLTANGRILLKEGRLVKSDWESFTGEGMDIDFSLDLAGLGEEIAHKVNEQIARATAELESRFGPDFSQRIADKAERAAAQAEKAAERAMRRFEKHVERSAQRQSRTGRAWAPPAPPVPPVPPTPPHKKSTAEEQLKILKMVENGTISPDEASMLLSALEN